VSVLLTIAELYVPRFVRRSGLDELFEATADAFQVTAPSTRGLAFDESLRLYAAFTREHAEEMAKQGETEQLQSRMFRNAYDMGAAYRQRFGLKTSADAMRMARVIYRLLRIDFLGAHGGPVLVRSCFFSAYYSAAVCRLISALDSGLVAGLCGGGSLRFSERITDGHGCCRARFVPGESAPAAMARQPVPEKTDAGSGVKGK
jgi:hypothetical protein